MTEAEQGSHSELGLPANAKSPIPEMGGTPIDRPFYRSRQCLPAGKTPLWYPSPSLESGLRYYFLFLGLVLLGSSLELTT